MIVCKYSTSAPFVRQCLLKDYARGGTVSKGDDDEVAANSVPAMLPSKADDSSTFARERASARERELERLRRHLGCW